jgi:prevent-host-death family protein
MTDSCPAGSRRQPTLAVPLAAAKDQLSALVARVEQGEEIAITRRGVPVVRLVPDAGDRIRGAGRHERVALALERLQQLRSGVVLEGDLRLIAREGLD